MTTYVGIIHKDAKSDYGISFPDFPGCISAGKTQDELKNMAEEALLFHVEGMLEDGEKIPKPMSLEQAKKHPFSKGAAAFLLVSIPMPTKPVRVNVMMDSNLLKRIEHVSSNRSAFVNEAVRNHLKNLHPDA